MKTLLCRGLAAALIALPTLVAAQNSPPSISDIKSQAREQLAQVPIAQLAKTDPFRAQAWMGAAATWFKLTTPQFDKLIQKPKQKVKDSDALERLFADELRARIAVLNGQALPQGIHDEFGYLELSRDPAAQVVVEYDARQAPQVAITFYAGSFPFAGAVISYANSDDKNDEFNEADTQKVDKKWADSEVPYPVLTKRYVANGASIELAARTPAALALVEQFLEKKQAVTPADAKRLWHLSFQEASPTLTTNNSISPTPFLTGDTHTHSSHSGDGAVAPMGLALQAIYANMDWQVLTDHSTIAGASKVQNKLDKAGVAFTVIPGVEVKSGPNSIMRGDPGHINLYPITGDLPPGKSSPREFIKAAHQQGAVAQWNHPNFDTNARQLEAALEWGFDTLEQPALVQHFLKDAWDNNSLDIGFIGGSDSHGCAYGFLTRTGFFADSPSGANLANAIRQHTSFAFGRRIPNYLIGNPNNATQLQQVQSLLYNWDAARQARAQRIANILGKVQLAAIID